MTAIVKNYLELSKFRMVPMVLITAVYGYVLGRNPFPIDTIKLLFTLVGFTLVSMGAASLNNVMEKDFDRLMPRTAHRVLPTGKMSIREALTFGLCSLLAGVLILVIQVNLLTALLMLTAALLYVLVYTPLKRKSWWNTFVGAIPGAMPPVAGWTAATNSLAPEAWILFLILFTWQYPHFFAIAILYHDDYRAGGYQMLPVIEEDRVWTYRHIMGFSVLLFVVSLLPWVTGMVSGFYLVGAILAGVIMLTASYLLCRDQDEIEAKRLFITSLVYLPVLFGLILIDRGML